MLPQHRSFCAPSAYEFREPAFAGSLSEKEPIAVLASLVIFLSVFLASSGSRPPAEARPQFSGGGNNCIHVGGSIITNFGAVDPNTTLGPATGDLRGAVAATLLTAPQPGPKDRKSTRLNSSHTVISYAVFCLK